MLGSSEVLERRLRTREPALKLISELSLLRIIARMRDAGERVPGNPRLPVWVTADHLTDIDLPPGHARYLLITTPDDRLLHGRTEAEVEAYYNRLLDRVYFQQTAQDTESQFLRLSEPVRREIRFVLESDRQIPDQASDAETARVFHAIRSELEKNRPDALADVFPLLSPDAGHEHLAEIPVTVSPPAIPDVHELVQRTKNHVRVAIEYYRRPEDRSTAIGVLCEGLGQRLQATLRLSTEQLTAWKAALAAILPHTVTDTWTPAARALYELQSMALDLASPLYAVAPFEWLRSRGQRPVRQPLDKASDIIRLRHLAKTERHLDRVALDPAMQSIWSKLLHHERESAEHRIQALLAPILRNVLDEAGLKPQSRVETVAREKLIAELLRTVCTQGFFRFADLRDAIARNNIKLNDLNDWPGFRTGGELLRADKLLAAELFGIYQRGEIYLRGIQRMSAVGFGTSIGRWVALFVLLPFGGAFLTLEFLQHLLHGALGLSNAIGLHTSTDHPHLVEWWTLLPLGGFALGLINFAKFRQRVTQAMKQLSSLLAIVFVSMPNYLWKSRLIRAIRFHWLTQYLWTTVALPLAIGLIATLLTILYSDLLSPAAAVGIGALAFVGSLILIHSPPGRIAYEVLAEAAFDTGRYVWASVLPGIVSWLVWIFREVADAVERILYSVDEWFRFREGQSRELLGLKVILAVVWFPIAYAVRFVFYLLVEPQVNPVKHFPVVTVSHKIIWPMVPQLARWTGLSTWTMGTIINGIPGIFGFIAWELKENWRLYAANRSERLAPIPIGHHGETMRGLLRPGFHSGTVPKLFRKLRVLHDGPTLNPQKHRQLHLDLHHIADSIERQITWEIVPLLEPAKYKVTKVTMGCQQITAQIRRPNGFVLVAWELINDQIVGTMQFEGPEPTADELAAIAGLHSLAAVVDPAPIAWTDWVKRWEPAS